MASEYKIIGIRYGVASSKIIQYKVVDIKSIWDLGSILDRFDLILRMNAGIKFVVFDKPNDNNPVPVQLVTINGNVYIKTIPNNTPEDNLGNLPEF